MAALADFLSKMATSGAAAHAAVAPAAAAGAMAQVMAETVVVGVAGVAGRLAGVERNWSSMSKTQRTNCVRASTGPCQGRVR